MCTALFVFNLEVKLTQFLPISMSGASVLESTPSPPVLGNAHQVWKCLFTGLWGTDGYQENAKFHSFHTINFWKGDVFILVPGGEHQGIAPHEVERQPPKQLAGFLSLFRAPAPSQG